MAIIGKLLKNRRADEALMAWHRPNLAAPETAAAIEVTSPAFADGASIPTVHAGKRIGGQDRSPELAWTGVPAGAAQLLLVVEDLDSPVKQPFVHCLALLDPALTGLPEGALAAAAPAEGVRTLRSAMGAGYLGPGPIKGHGPHRYVFQLFALGAPVPETVSGSELQKTRPGRALTAVTGPVLGRGKLTGTYER